MPSSITRTLLALIMSVCVLPFAADAATSKEREAQLVRQIITKVNSAWQKTHPAEATPFWHNATYHSANMEVYFLTGNDEFKNYSEKWADHNWWCGANGSDSSLWRYDYGETPDHVLFADWQTCFQTYADLYRVLPDEKRIRRTIDVMRHQISTPQNDYWWWADGLYMGMPVMTKLYKLTSDQRYLDKLYEYFHYTDSLLYDPEAQLYFRDVKYRWPEHQSANGQKDFWARGNGWVMAALAKVLKDLPADYEHRAFFEQRFMELAESVAALQRQQGYWSRSMMDEEMAPGFETSGTAFFTYGLLWGVNNGYLTATKYADTALKGWKYLQSVALQKDNSIGFVQPIGEKAEPGQKLTGKSKSDFGTGAFLLAACEYVRFLERENNADRAYWAKMAYDMAFPVLNSMSRGELQKTMTVEVSPEWDNRDKKTVCMEAFGRLMAGIAPWLSLPDDATPESAQRAKLRELALKSYANAVNPQSPDYLTWRSGGYSLVDAAYLAESFIRGYDALWVPLDTLTKQRYIDEFTQLRRVDPSYTNWLLFSSTIESFLARIGAQYDEYRINSAIRKTEEWYVGDGWYADAPDFAFDYYSSYVFHPMYLETLDNMRRTASPTRMHYHDYYRRALRRAQKFSLILERFIAPDGTFPVFGRSAPYRMAAMQPLALMAWYGKLPAGLTDAQVRGALTSVMHKMFDGKANYNKAGFLTIGFTGSQPEIADWYISNGSLYMTSLAFLPLGLPASHPFWTDAALPTTSAKAWSGKPFPKDFNWIDHPEAGPWH